MNNKLKYLITVGIIILLNPAVFTQNLSQLNFLNQSGLFIKTNESKTDLPNDIPFISMLVNDKLINTFECEKLTDSSYNVNHKIEITLRNVPFEEGLKTIFIIKNISRDTLNIRNLVPFGESDKHIYITGKGDNWLSRTHLFRPNLEPVNIIVPDNAWELGFSAIQTTTGKGICALTRRDRSSIQNGKIRRFETILFPNGSIKYTFWSESYEGEWQNALKLMFQERFLYDVEIGKFDNSLFEREDLKWFRSCYSLNIVYNWDTRHYYDYTKVLLNADEHLKNMKNLIGCYDVYSIWPTWPTLGMDQRNQWDLFRDLPGGLKGVKELSDICDKNGSKLFICYNPWDESTNYKEGHYKGLAKVIAETNSSGVVLDTRSESNKEIQNSVDSVRKGVIMYSEGMAVPKGMQSIPSGRVHNALYYPPLLNLNKLIKPDFVIFRVAEEHKERIKREFSLSFFNGYGTEINNMPAGKPEWVNEQYKFWGDLIRIQRENSSNFNSFDFVPLINTTQDKIYVNKWTTPNKIVYTIFSLIPQGFKGELFKVSNDLNYHYFDLYNYEEIDVIEKPDGVFVPVTLSSFNEYDLGTNNEGSIGAIAKFPELLKVSNNLSEDILTFSSPIGNTIRIWAGKPAYDKTPIEFGIDEKSIKLLDYFPGYEGKFVVQLFNKTEIIDERVLFIPYGSPRKISKSTSSAPANKIPKGMVEIPSGLFQCDEYITGDSFISYPENPTKKGEQIKMKKFYMDKFLVTNKQFKEFIDATNYSPKDTNNFLKHWSKNTIPSGLENYPVIYVSYEDAQAYCQWSGKRLPTEIEWQYAAQTSKGNQWPWVQKKPVKRVEEEITSTLSVFKLEGIEPNRCNLGDGKMYPVGHFPKGKNPYGLEDLVGSVWQLTNDIYFNTTHRYIIIKGGSYFLPASSWWYVQGGPRELNYRQYLLRVSPGFERNATIGFRCVVDAE
ncbi:MAG: formylglycine-generating enzyme family protein [Tenuifilaceae bacterium]